MRSLLLALLLCGVTSASEKDFPTPPKQNDPWTPPKAGVPEVYLKSASLLFEVGLADPRGFEYREVSIDNGEGWDGKRQKIELHGWLLPATKEGNTRFAICWDGQIYPLIDIGKPANLKRDVQGAIQRLKKEVKHDEELPGSWCLVTHHDIDHRVLGSFGLPLLLRLGEKELAADYYLAGLGEQTTEQPSEEETVLRQVKTLTWGLSERGMTAHIRGEDRLALSCFRHLDRIVKGLDKKKVALSRDKFGENRFSFLEVLPTLLSDQERRNVRRTQDDTICIGPGRSPDREKRIASLIRRLEDISADRRNFPSFSEWNGGPAFVALIREGEAALGPLLECVEKDKRLTRFIESEHFGFGGDHRERRRCVSVAEVAQDALKAILRFGHGARGALFWDELNPPVRKVLAMSLPHPLPHYWFGVLKDDKARPEDWLRAAGALSSREDQYCVYEPLRRGYVTRSLRSEGLPFGEPLRSLSGPGVTSLMLKRIGQLKEYRDAGELALTLGQWEPRSAVPPLQKFAKEILSKQKQEKEQEQDSKLLSEGDKDRFVQSIELRLRNGDRSALEDYAAWVVNIDPDDPLHSGERRFRPLWEHADESVIAKAAKSLFIAPDSPWRYVYTDDKDDATNKLLTLTRSPLLSVSPFRTLMLELLKRKGRAGTVEVRPEYTFNWDRRRDAAPREVPSDGALIVEFRVCDEVAYTIAEYFHAAPRFDMSWPLRQRDAAIVACIRFVEQYGDRLSSERMNFPSMKRPATAEDVASGRAVFTMSASKSETRVVPLRFPLDAKWIMLKERSKEADVYDADRDTWRSEKVFAQSGIVWQAEEVLRDGRWERYYGFGGSNRLEQVPAEEIEFPPDDDTSRRPTLWTRLGSGIDGYVEATGKRLDADLEGTPRYASDGPVLLRLIARNRSGLDRTPPPTDKLPRLKVWYSPAIVSSQGQLEPDEHKGWAEVAARPGASLPDFPRRTLSPAESLAGSAFDLRALFDLKRPGFYRVRLECVEKENQPPQHLLLSLAPASAEKQE